MPQVSLLIENMNADAIKVDTQKGYYKITLLSSDYSVRIFYLAVN